MVCATLSLPRDALRLKIAASFLDSRMCLSLCIPPKASAVFSAGWDNYRAERSAAAKGDSSYSLKDPKCSSHIVQSTYAGKARHKKENFFDRMGDCCCHVEVWRFRGCCIMEKSHSVEQQKQKPLGG